MPGERITTTSGNAYYWNFTTTKFTPDHLIWSTNKEKGKHIFQSPLCIKGRIAGKTLAEVENKFRELVEVKMINYAHLEFVLRKEIANGQDK